MFGMEDDDFEEDEHKLLPEEIEEIYQKYQPPPIDLSTRNIIRHPTYSDALRTSNNNPKEPKPSLEPIKNQTTKSTITKPNLPNVKFVEEQVAIQKCTDKSSKKQKLVSNPISAPTKTVILSKTQRKKLNKKLRKQGNAIAPLVMDGPPKATNTLKEKANKTNSKIVEKKVSTVCNGNSSATSNRDIANNNDKNLSDMELLSKLSNEEGMVRQLCDGNYSINQPSTSKSPSSTIQLQNKSVAKQTKAKKTKQKQVAASNIANIPVEKPLSTTTVSKKQKKSVKTEAQQGETVQKAQNKVTSKAKNKIQPLPLPNMVKPVLFCSNRPMELKREEVETKIEVTTKMSCSKFTPSDRLLTAINKPLISENSEEIAENPPSPGKLSKGQRKRINKKKRILESQKLAEAEEEQMAVSQQNDFKKEHLSLAEIEEKAEELAVLQKHYFNDEHLNEDFIYQNICKTYAEKLRNKEINISLLEYTLIQIASIHVFTGTTPKAFIEVFNKIRGEVPPSQDLIQEMSNDYSKYIYYNSNPLFKEVPIVAKNKKKKKPKTKKKLSKILKGDIPNCYHYYQYDNQNFVNFLRFKNQYLNGSLLTIKCIKNYLSTTEINHNATTFFANIMITQFLHAFQQLFELLTLVNISRNKFVEKCTMLLENKSSCFSRTKNGMYLPNKLMEEFMENLEELRRILFIEEINLQIKNGNIQNPLLIKRMKSLEMHTSKKVATVIFIMECNSPNFQNFNATNRISNFDHQLIISNELIRLNAWMKLFSAVDNTLPKNKKSLFDMCEVEKLSFLKTSRLENVEEVDQQYIEKYQVEITKRRNDVIEDTNWQKSIRIILQMNPNVIKLCLFVVVVRLLLPWGLRLFNYVLMNIILSNLDAIIFIFIFVFLCIFLVVNC